GGFAVAGRKEDANPGAVTRLAGDGDGAAMLLDDLLHGRQAEPGAEALGAEKRLEDAGQDLGWNPGAGILDEDFDLVRGGGGDTDPPPRPAPRWHRAPGRHFRED